MLEHSKWITTQNSYGSVCPKFKKDFEINKTVEKAVLRITALGCYEAHINEKRVGDFILAPGWTSYDNRLQVQEYRVEEMLGDTNTIEITVGEGWHLGGMCWRRDKTYSAKQPSVILEMSFLRCYYNGYKCQITTNDIFKHRH
jgi:alpha-L-rhamnosidase